MKNWDALRRSQLYSLDNGTHGWLLLTRLNFGGFQQAGFYFVAAGNKKTQDNRSPMRMPLTSPLREDMRVRFRQFAEVHDICLLLRCPHSATVLQQSRRRVNWRNKFGGIITQPV